MGDFTNKIAVVTGAGRGIGQQVARLLAEDGARLALLARSSDQLAQTAQLVKEAGGTAMLVPVDLTDRDQRAAAIGRVLAEYGAVDILINNAGMTTPIGPTATIDMAEWTMSVELSLIAPATLTAAVLPGMIERGSGHVVNVSNSVVDRPRALIGSNATVSGKTGLEAHTMNLAVELETTGVLVNAYRPGVVATSLLKATRDGLLAMHPGFQFQETNNVITPEASATAMLDHMREGVTGRIWYVEKTVS